MDIYSFDGASEILNIENFIAFPKHFVPLLAKVVLLAYVAHVEQFLAMLLKKSKDRLCLYMGLMA